ncbi:MAG: TIM barrel protein [Spiribacter salinus]|uniref:TIM barrel protein n=1 Tax=Spiribacter salinus TaxID=1335746 RepID=A0A540VNF9_9GAMM|nr:MAG: TIM barrel protein [Spiribacter salinus]
MILTKNVLAYVVSCDASLREALEKAHRGKIRTLFVVDENEVMVGTLSSGDISNWLIAQESVDLDRPVVDACNRDFHSVRAGTPPREIARRFAERVDVLPVVDDWDHLVALAFRDNAELRIGGFHVGRRHPALLIAEIGNNHNGSVELAKKLVDEAIGAAADCVKFQLRDMEAIYASQKGKGEEAEDLGSQYVMDLLSRFNLTRSQMYEVFDYCVAQGITPLCTPWDTHSIQALEEYGVPAYKVASADLTNHDLLRAVADTGKPLLVSTGMSTENEIASAVQLLMDHSAQFVLLHCNSTYPAPFKDINLAYLERLKELGQGIVGYSGHERGYSVPIAAVAQGAKIIEKHFTLDRSMEGNDHKVSLLPDEFREMVNSIRRVEEAMGTGDERIISQGELMNRETLAKSLVASQPIAEGEVISGAKVGVAGPGKGLQPAYRDQLLGRTARRSMAAGDFFYPSDLEEAIYQPRAFQFSRPWGIPVRYHDFAELTEEVTPDFVEFHFSYKDLELDPADWIGDTAGLGFVVHAPELFAGDHLLDLATDSVDYARTSMSNLARVVTVTRALKWIFPGTDNPMIITNMGGFTENEPLGEPEKEPLYRRMAERLREMDLKGIELLPQTMPPFPWHFGGQRYHNLFVHPGEIREFCEANGMRICLDISHSKLACNYFGWSLEEFIAEIGPYVAHIHVVDAVGRDEEGLQIGKGGIDFLALGRVLAEHCPQASFIPEIWQGHKNSGEGFWKALDALEGLV